ncbi:TonB-dependent receptor [Mucilaginibacter arboris]|nr:TonB-dependent receptor [Mucilaginibacter arboris]
MKIYYWMANSMSYSHRKVLMIMKLTFVLMIAILFQARAGGYAQKITLSGENVSMGNVLKKISRQSGYDFFYNSSLIKKAKPVNINLKNASLEEALVHAFANQPFSYTIDENTVVVKEKQQHTNAAPIQVKGKVVDEKGEPLTGVTVKVKGSQQAVSTNLNGEFTLSDVPSDAVLQFSFIGYLTKELPAKPNLGTIRMAVNESKLNEVVVVGYGSVKKGDLTGAVASLKPTETEAATFTSVDRLFQGKIAGVNVSTTTAQPGAAVSVIIRGANSLRGDNQPLYVIDNVPQQSTGAAQPSPFSSSDIQTAQNPLVALNPEDIESIDVLKDASATAIYGSRGANGVIIITTKKGKKGRAKLNLSYNTTVSTIARKRDLLDATDYANYQNSQNAAGGVLPSYYFSGNEVRFYQTGTTGPAYNPSDPSTYSVIQDVDWQNVAYHNAVSQNAALSASGGTDNTTYYLSGGFKNIQGISRGSGLKLGTFRATLISKLTERLNLNLVLGGSMGKNNMSQGGDNLRGTGNANITRDALSSQPFILPPNSILNDENRTSVNSWLADYDDIANTGNFNGSLNLKYTISNAFNYSVRVGGVNSYNDRARWFGTSLFPGYNTNGNLGVSNTNSTNYTIENILGFNKQISPVFKFDGILGATYDNYNSLINNVTGTNFNIYSLRTKGLALANVVNVATPLQSDYQIASFLGRANFDFFGGKYLATLNFRADGSSKFQKDKWGYFPAAALAWKIDQEDFIKNSGLISQLKLRVGWGITGNQSIAPYSTINQFTTSNISYADPSGNKLLAASSVGLANTNLTWETTQSDNLGLDFGILKNRINGSIDVYRKTTTDLLLSKTIPASNGFTSLLVNQGSIRNQGIELALNGEILRNSAVKLSLNGNIAVNRSKVLDIGQLPAQFGANTLSAFTGNAIGQSFYQDYANIFAVGYAPGMFYGYKTDGIIQNLNDITYTAADGTKKLTTYSIITGGASPKVGDVKFVDVNGDGVVNANDRTFIGNPNPAYTYGFGFNLSYKKFNLSSTFYGVQGIQKINANDYFEAGTFGTSNIRQDVYNSIWTPQNPGNTTPRIGASNITVISDRIVENASFLRMSDVTLSYTLPDQVMKRMGLGRSSFYISGKNLLLLTKYKGYDPEVNSFGFDGLRQGIDWNGFPNAKSFILGINIGL